MHFANLKRTKYNRIFTKYYLVICYSKQQRGHLSAHAPKKEKREVHESRDFHGILNPIVARNFKSASYTNFKLITTISTWIQILIKFFRCVLLLCFISIYIFLLFVRKDVWFVKKHSARNVYIFHHV